MQKYITPPVDHGGFTWQEFTKSETAWKNNIRNIPGQKEQQAIIELVANLLQPLRLLYGKPIRISSGYRTRELNPLTGGAYESQHIRGEAADLVIPEGPAYLLDLLETSGLDFDQAIVYTKRHFLHLSYKADGTNRRQILHR